MARIHIGATAIFDRFGAGDGESVKTTGYRLHFAYRRTRHRNDSCELGLFRARRRDHGSVRSIVASLVAILVERLGIDQVLTQNQGR